jgi:hypothetical protein
MPETQALIQRDTVESLCDAYNQTRADILEAHRLIQTAEARINAKIDYAYPSGAQMKNRHIDAVLLDMKKSVWRHIFRHTGLRGLMSLQNQRNLDKQLDTGEGLPDITVESVLGLVSKLSGDLPGLVEETIREVFDILRPRGKWDGGQYKTNSEYEVGAKVILTGAMSYHGERVGHGRSEDELRALQNVFQLLDGKGPVTDHCGELVNAINLAGREKDSWRPGAGSCETEYFRVKWCKNRNIHLEFKRLDLVKELNRRAGGMRLKHDADARRQAHIA